MRDNRPDRGGEPAIFETTDALLARQQAPGWFTRAKFGIFVRRGVYSALAWAPVGPQYLE
jgi:hypothetical protein